MAIFHRFLYVYQAGCQQFGSVAPTFRRAGLRPKVKSSRATPRELAEATSGNHYLVLERRRISGWLPGTNSWKT